MKRDAGIWFRLGYAWERARHGPEAMPLRGLLERRNGGDAASKDRGRPAVRQRDEKQPGAEAGEALDALIATGAGALAGRLLGLFPARGRPGVLALARAGAAGAGAALLREILDPLLRGEGRLRLGPQAAEALMAGAARGLMYAAVLEPRLPGPPPLQGVVYGSIEYALSPWGGLTTVLGERAPHRHIPLFQGLFEDYASGGDGLADHLIFGVALALFYGATPAEPSSGTSGER